MTVTITATGFDVAIAAFERLDETMLERLTQAVGFKVQEQTINHFRESSGPEGAWAPTKKGNKPLIRTGTLRGSIQTQPAGNLAVAIGTNVGYGRFHQEGTSRIPRRMFLGLTDRDLGEIEQVVTSYIERVIGGG